MSRKTEDNMGHKFQSKSLPAAIKLRNFRPAFFYDQSIFSAAMRIWFSGWKIETRHLYTDIYVYSNYVGYGWRRWDLEIIHVGNAKSRLLFTPNCSYWFAQLQIDIHGENITSHYRYTLNDSQLHNDFGNCHISISNISVGVSHSLLLL